MPFSKQQQKDLKALGKKIKQLRTDRKMTQKELAHAIEKDPQAIHRVEIGSVNPGYLFLLQIAEGLAVDIKELLP